MIPQLDDRGELPLGRHPAELHELGDRFATARYRVLMFDELVDFASKASGAFGGLPYLWVGGSFVSDEPSPSDIDVVCVIEESRLARALRDQGDGRELALGLSERSLGPEFRSLDLGLLPVRPPFVGHFADADDAQREALGLRGYWDALWSSRRTDTGKVMHGDRGYLEVRIDGYS